MTLAIVTGASRGIGRAIACALARRGVDLILVGRPSAELSKLQADLAGTVRVCVETCDLAAASSVAASGARLANEHAPDVLINNAGVVERAAIEDTTAEAWDRQLAVNLRAPFQLTRALLPGMRRRRQGRIINVGSISSTVGSPRAAAYAASKWGLVGFTKSLAQELSDSGVSTLVVLPGSVDTEMLAGSGFAPRMTAEDVASTIVFHALDAPAAHNGAVIEMFGT
ncbi:MAG: SDR family oxidoreductase [Myxococcales bacterium]|nr:SDR family oxidoreductase [Myxococcales bacterium]